MYEFPTHSLSHCSFDLKFFGTFIYGMTDKKERLLLWEDLATLARRINGPW